MSIEQLIMALNHNPYFFAGESKINHLICLFSILAYSEKRAVLLYVHVLYTFLSVDFTHTGGLVITMCESTKLNTLQ